MNHTAKLLLEEPPLQVLPTLAIAIGLNESIVLQQLHYLLRDPRFGRRIADHQWIFNTYEEWRASYFPFWSADTIKRTFTSLAKMKLIVSCQPEGGISRRKYYRIDRDKLEAIAQGCRLHRSSGHTAPSGGAKPPVPITKTTPKTSCKESKEDASETSATADARSFPDIAAVWKPIQGTKAEQLKRLRPPSDYPSEAEFEEHIDNSMLLELGQGKRADLYETLCDRKWHHWTGRKWVPIRSWRDYIQALDEKMSKATAHDNSGAAFRMPR